MACKGLKARVNGEVVCVCVCVCDEGCDGECAYVLVCVCVHVSAPAGASPALSGAWLFQEASSLLLLM